MALRNTQLGYQKPRNRGVYAMPQAPRTPASTGVTRALAGVQPPPAAPSFRSPYADPTGSLFPATDYPGVQSQAPPGTPSTYAPQTAQAPAAPAGYSFDLETDPILQQMHAMAAKQRTEAESSALAQRKQLAIQYGDQGYGNTIDENTGQAAAQNPFSVTKNLASQYETGQRGLEEQLNQHNLFYSGARINELANALKDYQQQQATAAGSFQSALGGVDQNRIAALMGADQGEQGAYNDAWSRALAAALAAGSGPEPPPTEMASEGAWGTAPAPLYATAPGAMTHLGDPGGPPVLEHPVDYPVNYGGQSAAPRTTASRQPQPPDLLARYLLGLG